MPVKKAPYPANIPGHLLELQILTLVFNKHTHYTHFNFTPDDLIGLLAHKAARWKYFTQMVQRDFYNFKLFKDSIVGQIK